MPGARYAHPVSPAHFLTPRSGRSALAGREHQETEETHPRASCRPPTRSTHLAARLATSAATSRRLRRRPPWAARLRARSTRLCRGRTYRPARPTCPSPDSNTSRRSDGNARNRRRKRRINTNIHATRSIGLSRSQITRHWHKRRMSVSTRHWSMCGPRRARLAPRRRRPSSSTHTGRCCSHRLAATPARSSPTRPKKAAAAAAATARTPPRGPPAFALRA